jgi:hypothetical protein
MLALLDRAVRIGRLETLRLEARFKLFALRDGLRRAAIEESVPQNKWFEYLDTSITKAIDMLPHINAWEVLALMYRYSDDESVLDAHIELQDALQQEENQGLQKIYAEYILCIAWLLVERHRTSGVIALKVAKTVGRAVNLRDSLATIVSIAPETSTLLQHHS